MGQSHVPLAFASASALSASRHSASFSKCSHARSMISPTVSRRLVSDAMPSASVGCGYSACSNRRSSSPKSNASVNLFSLIGPLSVLEYNPKRRGLTSHLGRRLELRLAPHGLSQFSERLRREVQIAFDPQTEGAAQALEFPQ